MRRLLSFLIVIFLVACGGAPAQINGAPPGMPANVQAIMKRLQSGVPPTQAEQKILKDYLANAASAASAGAAGVPGGGARSGRMAMSASATNGGINPHAPTMTSSGTFTVGSGLAQNPCHPAGKALGFGTTPSQAAYVAMAKDAMRTYRAHLTPEAQSSLDSALEQSASPTVAAGAAAILVIHGNGSAAVVSAAYAAEKSPADPVTANNLGAILRGMHDYARAAVALQYAQSLSPKSAVIASNLGWLAMSQGDSKTAGNFFGIAMKSNAKLSPALLGQGLIDQCAGKPAQALPLFRASIANGFSDLAEAGVDSAENSLASANDSSADNASPDVYGGNGSGGDGGMPNWQDPPFDHDAGKFASGPLAKPNPLRDYIDNYINQLVTDAHNTVVSAGPKIKGGETSGTGRSLTFTRGNAKEAFEISDIIGIIGRDTAPIVDKFSTDVANDVQQDGCHSCVGAPPIQPKCSARGGYVAIHAGLASEEAADWTKLRKSMADLYGFTKPLIARIKDSNAAQVETASLQTWSAMQMAGFTATMTQWQNEGMIAYDPQDCGPKASTPVNHGALQPYKVDPTQCHSGSMSMNFGFANLNADCDKMTLTIGEGLVGAATWNFAPDYTKMADGSLRPTGTDWSNDMITVFAGAGASGTGPLTGNAAAGGYVSVQNGNVIDAGIQAQGGVTIGNGNNTPVTGQAGATAQVSLMNGPDTPTSSGTTVGTNVSTSAGPRTGGPCGVSC